MPSKIKTTSDNKTGKPEYKFKRMDPRHDKLLQLFDSVLNVKGRRFGQLNKPTFGISDGNDGVQWNLSVNKKTNEIQLGVNLKGCKKPGKWLIAQFVLNKPDIERLKSRTANPQDLTLRFSRDAWQAASRPFIREKFLGEREFRLSEINQATWSLVLNEALTCLDKDKNYRGRRRAQPVTLESDGRKLIRDISPHLTIWTLLDIEGDLEANIRKKFDELQPVYDWVVEACRS